MNGKLFFTTAAAVFGAALFAQDVDPDLPQESGTAKSKSYIHDEGEVITAFHGIYSGIFTHKWLDAPHDGTEPIPQAEQDRISDTWIAECRRRIEAAPKKPSLYDELGQALVYRERWDEAIAVYERELELAKSLKNSRMSQQYRGEAMYRMAECLLGKGERDKSRALLQEMLAAKLESGGWVGAKTKLTNYNSRARRVLYWLDGARRLDGLGLPRWTDLKPFPEPQEAVYTETKVKCPVLAVELAGVKRDDPRVKLLELKLSRRGYRLDFGRGAEGYRVRIALEPQKCAVKHSEGYELEATAEGCSIRGYDRQGVLWGIVSLIQILDPKTNEIRLQRVKDYPACPRRGFLGRCCVHDAEFMLFNKMNLNTAKPAFLTYGEYTPFNLYMSREMAKDHRGYGMELYFGAGNMTMDICWPICWKVFGAMQIDEFRKWAACGVGVYYPYDDARYWTSGALCAEDEATGLKPSDYDADHVMRVYEAVKAEYPDFKLHFCPPFYWGPTKGHPYPDDRTKYLKSLRRFPDDVMIVWSGERVGSLHKDERDCAWFTKLTGHRPSLFQNKAGRHFYLSYGPDEMPWDEWYYPGFVDRDAYAIQKNSDTPGDYIVLTTLADYCWNPKAYDRARSAARGCDLMAGKGVYEILKPAHDCIVKGDKYKFAATDSRINTENLEEWESGSKVISEATAKAREIAGDYVIDHCMGSWNRGAGWYDQILRKIRARPDFRAKYAKQLAVNAETVKSLTNLVVDASHDIVFDALEFGNTAARTMPKTKKKSKKPRFEGVWARLEHEQDSDLVFTLDHLPEANVKLSFVVQGSYALYSSAILVNGQIAFECGPKAQNPANRRKLSPFVSDGFGLRSTMLDKSMFRLGENRITFRNNCGTGYPVNFLYAVLKAVK